MSFKKVRVIDPKDKNALAKILLMEIDDFAISSSFAGGSSVVSDLSSIGDVVVAGASANDVLIWNGLNWINQTMPIGSSPTITNLSNIGDVGTLQLSAGDILVWDGSRWSATSINAFTSGSTDITTHVCDTSIHWGYSSISALSATINNLSSIGDFDGSSAEEGEIIYFSSGVWRDTSQITIGDSLVTILGALQVSSVLIGGSINVDVSSLDDVGDVSLSPGDILVWDGASWSATAIQYYTTCSIDIVTHICDTSIHWGYSSISALSATIDNISNIGDVLLTGVSASDTLVYDGANWIHKEISSVITSYPSSTVTELSSIGDVETSPDDGDFIWWNCATHKWNATTINFPSSTITELSAIMDVCSDASAGDVLYWDGAQWEQAGVINGGSA